LSLADRKKDETYQKPCPYLAPEKSEMTPGDRNGAPVAPRTVGRNRTLEVKDGGLFLPIDMLGIL
jgi:hypothetical protein